MDNIRLATHDDIPALVSMARAFINYGPHGTLIDITDEQLAVQARVLLDIPTVSVFVAEMHGDIVAMLIGALTSPWFAPHVTMATELAWWVQPEARGTRIAFKLVKMYEGWAHANGAQLVSMSSMEMDTGPNVGNMLQRLGYAKAETTHIKEVC